MKTNVFNTPLKYRCSELTQLINTASIKELENLFPHIIDNIFGVNGQTNWGLRTIESGTYVFEEMYSFLHPLGSMFKLCYKLLSICHLHFEFSYSHLSEIIQRHISSPMKDLFYSSKVQFSEKTQSYILSLNAFEYYVFHFAYHLVNPNVCVPPSDHSSACNTLYVRLVILYLQFFLPCSSSVVLPVLPNMNTQSSRLISPNILGSNSQGLKKKPSIFREDVMRKLDPHSSLKSSTYSPSAAEIWRTELVARLFIDYWLVTENHSFKNELVPSLFYVQSLPACSQHLCSVRVLFKHLHYFSSYASNEDCMMNVLRRDVIRKNHVTIYQFFYYTIGHYPLDSSFALLLETWLSFIQPWRYSDLNNPRRYSYGIDSDEDMEYSIINRNWFFFIAENLLTYTRIYYLILLRLCRSDLTLFKHAHMLLRLTKVFSQQNLVNYINEVEGHLDKNKVAAVNNLGSFIEENIYGMENHDYQYVTFNSQTNRDNVIKAINQIRSNIAVIQTKLLKNTNKENSFIDWFKEQFSSDGDYMCNAYELQKTMECLTCSLHNLASIHQVDASISLMEDNLSTVSSFKHNSSDMVDNTMNISHLSLTNTPQDWKERVISLKHECDPDVQPHRSWEISIIIPILIYISNYVNTKFSEHMNMLYYDTSIFGNIARQIICPPLRVYRYQKKHPPNGYTHRSSVLLPPRITLRWMASTPTFILFFIFVCISAYGFLSVIPILWVLTFYIVFIVMKGFFNPYPIVNVQDTE